MNPAELVVINLSLGLGGARAIRSTIVALRSITNAFALSQIDCSPLERDLSARFNALNARSHEA
jgi:hypothetical protein